MGTTEVRAALAIAVQIGQPVLLWGDPGQGKTSVLLQVADALDRPCEVVIGSIREASDFAGLPMRVDDAVSFVPPAWARRCTEAPTTVVFLDELTTAPPAVQAAMLRVEGDRAGRGTVPGTAGGLVGGGLGPQRVAHVDGVDGVDAGAVGVGPGELVGVAVRIGPRAGAFGDLRHTDSDQRPQPGQRRGGQLRVGTVQAVLGFYDHVADTEREHRTVGAAQVPVRER